MDQRSSKEMHRSFIEDENLGSRFLAEAKSMTSLVLEDAGRHSEIAERWDKILQLRNSEIDRLILDEIHESRYDIHRIRV